MKQNKTHELGQTHTTKKKTKKKKTQGYSHNKYINLKYKL